jgi:MerR family transcriptional regulator, copper efflux regulator
MTTPDESPLVCTLGDDDAKARREAWQAAGAGLHSLVATPTGVRLAFGPDAGTAHVLLDLVAAERRCCAWASWTLTSSEAATVVEVDTRESAVQGLQAMFGLTEAPAAPASPPESSPEP